MLLAYFSLSPVVFVFGICICLVFVFDICIWKQVRTISSRSAGPRTEDNCCPRRPYCSPAKTIIMAMTKTKTKTKTKKETMTERERERERDKSKTDFLICYTAPLIIIRTMILFTVTEKDLGQ